MKKKIINENIPDEPKYKEIEDHKKAFRITKTRMSGSVVRVI